MKSRRNTFATESTFPKTKFKAVRDTPSSRHGKKFFAYWASIPEAKQDLAVVHVYRLWPIVDVKALDPNATIEWDTIRGKIPFEPDEYESFFLHKYGSGEWKCIITESGVDGKIMEAFFSAVDLDHHPPKIDYRTLIKGNFKNQDYVKWLERQPGLDLPWTRDPEEEEQKTDMNIATVAIDALQKQNERNQDKIQEQLEEITERLNDDNEDESADAMAPSPVATTVLETGLRMIEKQVDRVTEQSAKSYNPLEVLDHCMTLAEKLKGDSSGAISAMQLMMDMQVKTLNAIIEQSRADTSFWRDQALKVRTEVAVSGPKSTIEQLSELRDFKTLARDLFGSTRERVEDREPEPARKSWFETLMENPQFPTMLNTGLALVANIVYNMTHQGPNAKSPEEVLKGALNGANGNGNAVASQNPPAPDPQAQARQATLQFLQRIEKTFITHFFDTELQGLNGYTFAHCMHCEFVPDGSPTPAGRNEYMTIRDRWGQQFDQLLRSYAPIWNMVQGNPSKYAEFLKEFFGYDQYISQQNEPEEPGKPRKVASVS